LFTTEHAECTESKHWDFLGGLGDLGGWLETDVTTGFSGCSAL